MENIEMERAGAIALGRIFGDEPKVSRALVEAYGSACAPFETDPEELHKRFPYKKGIDRIGPRALDLALKELHELENAGKSVVCILEDNYPKALKECEDAPVGLYYRSGTPAGELFNGAPCISVVGTRDLSSYGKQWCERIVFAIAGSPVKPVIVSGLAIGVDITAQMAALAAGLPTIGVLPCGIDEVYPRRHSVAAGKIIASKGGALITDYPQGVPTYTCNFLKRNRIIAGMSIATILIESRAKGGGMMTAHLASSYGRDVFALPGRIDDPRSEGCNLLLRSKTAEPVVDLDHLCEDLGLERFSTEKKEDMLARVRERFRGDPGLDLLLKLTTLIRETRGISLEELCRGTGLPFSDVSTGCWALESEGIIEMDMLQRCSITAKFF